MPILPVATFAALYHAANSAMPAPPVEAQPSQAAKTTAPVAAAPALGAAHVTRLYAVAPNVLAVVVEVGVVSPSTLGPYIPQPGDKRKNELDAKSLDGFGRVRLLRGDREVGWLIGAKRDTLVTDEQRVGSDFSAASWDTPSAWSVTSSSGGATGDASFSPSVRPDAVFRKTKPTDWAQPSQAFAFRHIFYLKLPKSLTVGRTYQVTLPPGAAGTTFPIQTFIFAPAQIRSDAVHGTQIGYRPDDPLKRAYLSEWLGTGGAFSYADSLTFHVVNEATGKSVFDGKTVLMKRAADNEPLWRDGPNRSKTDIWRMDFAPVRSPGTFRVVVDGVGCGYPFTIGTTTWEKAFQTQMRGFYHQRSGIALGPPYTKFVRPRDLHPADGTTVFASTYSVLDGGGDAFAGLLKNKTSEPLPGAWGGYHDAGDWNPRHTDHLRATLLQLELFDISPKYFGTLRWNIPRNGTLPDLLAEAEWHVSLFLRLQTPQGGIRHGIESTSDPYDGEVSWHQSQTQMAFAPDMRSSYVYVAAAARLARLITAFNKPLGQTYRTSALRAMNWAEADLAARTPDDQKKLPWETGDERNLAALELYALTHEPKWHDLFKQTTCLTRSDERLFVWGSHVQYEAAFAYARLPASLTETALRQTAINGTVREANLSLDYAASNAFSLTTPDKGRPLFLGFFSAPDAQELIRAHVLTKQEKYLAGAVAAAQFASGANPANMTYTTGVGQNPPLHPLHLDSRRSGQAAPDGLTVYGNIDFVNWTDSFWTWPIQYFLNTACTPPAKDWPITEAYFDIMLYPAMTEFTIQQTMGPNAYVWGYLAARP